LNGCRESDGSRGRRTRKSDEIGKPLTTKDTKEHKGRSEKQSLPRIYADERGSRNIARNAKIAKHRRKRKTTFTAEVAEERRGKIR
jgi:hypothetical protein